MIDDEFKAATAKMYAKLSDDELAMVAYLWRRVQALARGYGLGVRVVRCDMLGFEVEAVRGEMATNLTVSTFGHPFDVERQVIDLMEAAHRVLERAGRAA